MAWKQGPLPPDTYGWGGVVPTDDTPGLGFSFADFQGDRVRMRSEPERTLLPHEVAWYDNSLTLPPKKGP